MKQVILAVNSSDPVWYAAEPPLFGESPGEERYRRLYAHAWRPPTDVFYTEEAVFVRLEIAGMQPSDFNILVQDSLLVVFGTRPAPEQRGAYQQMEIRFGEFRSEVELTVPVRVEEAQAEYRDGFLTISLPRMLPRQIHISPR